LRHQRRDGHEQQGNEHEVLTTEFHGRILHEKCETANWDDANIPQLTAGFGDR